MNNDLPDNLAAADLQTDRPHSARIWNYWLGGMDNYRADREAGDAVDQIIPGVAEAARHCRGFLTRAVDYLVTQEGVRQFLDIGTGLPTVDNTHEVAQRLAPSSRIVYVDNDPLVLVHARALLTSSAEGACDYIDADVGNPEYILDSASGTLDFSQPIALMLVGIMNHILDDDQAGAIVNQLVAALPSGSFLAIGHPTAELHGESMHESMRQVMKRGGTPICARSPEQIRRFFDGIELLEPGVVAASRWRPVPSPSGPPAEVAEFCALGRKP